MIEIWCRNSCRTAGWTAWSDWVGWPTRTTRTTSCEVRFRCARRLSPSEVCRLRTSVLSDAGCSVGTSDVVRGRHEWHHRAQHHHPVALRAARLAGKPPAFTFSPPLSRVASLSSRAAQSRFFFGARAVQSSMSLFDLAVR